MITLIISHKYISLFIILVFLYSRFVERNKRIVEFFFKYKFVGNKYQMRYKNFQRYYGTISSDFKKYNFSLING